MPAKGVRLRLGRGGDGFHGLRLFRLAPDRGPFSALRIEVAPRTDLPCVRHERMWEFFYVLKGRGWGRVGRKSVRFGPGDCVTIPPKTAHDFHTGRSSLEALVVFSPRFDPARPDVLRCG